MNYEPIGLNSSSRAPTYFGIGLVGLNRKIRGGCCGRILGRCRLFADLAYDETLVRGTQCRKWY
jgi:hypothetical protein